MLCSHLLVGCQEKHFAWKSNNIHIFLGDFVVIGWPRESWRMDNKHRPHHCSCWFLSAQQGFANHLIYYLFKQNVSGSKPLKQTWWTVVIKDLYSFKWACLLTNRKCPSVPKTVTWQNAAVKSWKWQRNFWAKNHSFPMHVSLIFNQLHLKNLTKMAEVIFCFV